MKKVTLVVIAILGFNTLINAQEQGKVRVGLDVGYAIPKGGAGISFALEPKYNIADDMSVGLRIQSAALAKEVGELETSVSANASYVATFDKYFSSGSSFVPYVGGGIGYFALASVGFDDTIANTGASVALEQTGKIGGLLRAGFEVGHFRMGLEYNLVPKSKIEALGATLTEISNSYIGVSIGFYVGGGKWKS